MRLLVLFFLAFCFQSEIYAQTIFELDGSQSMLMTGKGPGQDATINPFQGEDCYAIIENLGNELFSVRIQQEGEIVKIIAVKPKKKKKIKRPLFARNRNIISIVIILYKLLFMY